MIASILTSIRDFSAANPWPTTLIVLALLGVLMWGTWFDRLATLQALLRAVGA